MYKQPFANDDSQPRYKGQPFESRPRQRSLDSRGYIPANPNPGWLLGLLLARSLNDSEYVALVDENSSVPFVKYQDLSRQNLLP